MTLEIWFWIIYIIALVFFGYRNRANSGAIVDSLVFWILIGILGFAQFGSPVK